MRALDIYKEYQTMPLLAQHMLRVTAVASLICDSIQTTVDKDSIIEACLLHDMGNIIKFDLGQLPDALQPEGLKHWENIKNEFIKKYGQDEHSATLSIAREIGVKPYVLSLVGSFGFSNAIQNSRSNDINLKICAYSDMRVSPYGVLTLNKRLTDLKKRYEYKKHKNREQHFAFFSDNMKSIEKQVFENSDIKPRSITQKNVDELIETLADTKIRSQMR